MRKSVFLRLPRPLFLTRVAVLAIPLALAACSGGDKDHPKESPAAATKKKPEKRERIAVLTFDRNLSPDSALTDVRVTLPPPWRNPDWPVAGGSSTNAMYHVALPADLHEAWRRRVVSSAGDLMLHLSPPVIADGRIFLIDYRGTAIAIDARNGRTLWHRSLKPKKEKAKLGFGGGVAYADGLVFAASGFGLLVAFDAQSGEERWRHDGLIPFRGAPAVAGGRIFAVTLDNQIVALSTKTGEMLWTQAGLPEDASLLGAATAAVSGDTVVIGLSSGELFALRATNGQLAWQDTLSRTRRLTPLATLADIDGFPVIDRGRVYAVSHAGRMVAIDLRSGERVWESNIAGVRTPWVAGDYIFLVTVDAEVVAISAGDGKIRWVTRLERFADPRKRKKPVIWSGPVLAGDRLILASSNGFALSLSPYTGKVLSGVRLRGRVVAPPVVADGTLYFFTNEGTLIAWRER